MENNPVSPQRGKNDDSSMYDEVEEDNEETIDAEEALAPIMDPEEELRLLSEDLDVSVAELRSMWQRRSTRTLALQSESGAKRKEPSTSEMTHNTSEPSVEINIPAEATVCDTIRYSTSELRNFYLSDGKISEDEDEDYIPFKKLNREVRVGLEYQAEVTAEPTFTPSEDSTAMEELLWSPSTTQAEDDLASYIKSADEIIYTAGSSSDFTKLCKNQAPTSERVDDLSLQCLMRCNYETQPALAMLTEIVKLNIKNITNASSNGGKHPKLEETFNEFCNK